MDGEGASQIHGVLVQLQRQVDVVGCSEQTNSARFRLLIIMNVHCKQWRIQWGLRGHAPQTHDHQKKSCDSCLLSSWLSALTLAIIKLLHIHHHGKYVQFSAVLCRNFRAFDWATVSLECQTGQWTGVLEICTWTYYSAETSTQMG